MKSIPRAGLALVLLLLLAWPATSATWKVGPTSTSCDGTCNFFAPPTEPGTALVVAVNAVQVIPGDTLLVWPGNYTARFFMKSGVTMRSRYGAPTAIISVAAGSEAGVQFLATNASTSLEGFTVRGLSGAQGLGGAISAIVAGGTIRDCVIRDCEAGVGAGVYLQSSSLILENNLFLSNQCLVGGGVIAVSGGSPIIRNNTIYGSYCPFGADGSAFFAVGSEHTFERNIVAHSSGGAAIFCSGGTLEPDFTCNIVWDNPLGHFGGSCVDSTGTSGNIAVDPQICDPTYGPIPDIGDFNVCSQSVARTTACGTIGWVDPAGEIPCGDCAPTPVVASLEYVTWGQAKARYR